MQAGFAAGLDGTVDHPIGRIPRTMFIGFRIMDNGTLGFARAIGADETLDADLVSRMWDDIQPMAGVSPSWASWEQLASGDVGDDRRVREPASSTSSGGGPSLPVGRSAGRTPHSGCRACSEYLVMVRFVVLGAGDVDRAVAFWAGALGYKPVRFPGDDSEFAVTYAVRRRCPSRSATG